MSLFSHKINTISNGIHSDSIMEIFGIIPSGTLQLLHDKKKFDLDVHTFRVGVRVKFIQKLSKFQ